MNNRFSLQQCCLSSTRKGDIFVVVCHCVIPVVDWQGDVDWVLDAIEDGFLQDPDEGKLKPKKRFLSVP